MMDNWKDSEEVERGGFGISRELDHRCEPYININARVYDRAYAAYVCEKLSDWAHTLPKTRPVVRKVEI